jgi:hypothetical protein
MQKRTVYILLILILLAYLFLGQVFTSRFGFPVAFSDYVFHLDKLENNILPNTSMAAYLAQGTPQDQFIAGFSDYANGAHHILGFFGVHGAWLLYLAMLMLVFAIPTIILTEKFSPWAGFLYLTIELAHIELLMFTLPQAFIVILLLIYLYDRKNWPLLGALFLLSITLHSHGGILFGAIILFEIIDLLLSKVLSFELPLYAIAVLPSWHLSASLQTLFLLQTPIWLILAAWKRILASPFKTLLFLFTIILSLASDPRVAFAAEIILVTEASKAIEENPKYATIYISLGFLVLVYLMVYYLRKSWSSFLGF